MALNRLVTYATAIEETVRFYQAHFGFRAVRSPGSVLSGACRKTE